MKILVISDTHNSLPIDISSSEYDGVIHAGDIGNDPFISNFYCFRVFHAVAGNTDFISCVNLPETLCCEVGEIKIFVVHNLSAPHRIISSNLKKISDCQPRLVIFGHTHSPLLEERNGIIYLNPGSLGKTGLTGLKSYASVKIEKKLIISIEIINAETGKKIDEWQTTER